MRASYTTAAAVMLTMAFAGGTTEAALWVGDGGDDNWSTGMNWDGGDAPVAQDVLNFDGDDRLANVNDFAANTQFNGINFLETAGAFELSGNAINLGGDIDSASDVTQTLNMDLHLLQDTGFHISVDDSDARMTFNGNISGDYGLTLSGSHEYGTNRITLSGVNTYAGTTTVGAPDDYVTGWITDPDALPGDVVVVDGSTLRLRPEGANTTFSNNISISGDGAESLGRATWAARQSAGALVVNNGADVTGTVTLLGDSRISANRAPGGGDSGTISGQITGDYALQFGFLQERPGTVTITNPDNDWTGDTFVTGGGATNSSGRVFTLRLGADNVLPSGHGYGNLIINTNNTRVETLGNDQAINGLYGNNTDARLTGGGTLTLGNGDADGDYPGHLSVTNLVKTGSGTQELAGRTAISDDLSVNDGTLRFTGGLATPGTVTVDSGANLELDGGALRYTSATDYTGPFNFISGRLEGTNWGGSLSGLTIGTGQTVAPGSSPGAAVTGDQTWAPGGTFEFEIDDAEGDAGINWDHLTVNNVLDITGLSSADPFIIELVAEEGLAGFSSSQQFVWEMVEFGSLSGAFSSDLFAIDTTAFEDDLGNGYFEVQQHGNTLAVAFVPEPASLTLVGLGALVLLGRRRGRDA